MTKLKDSARIIITSTTQSSTIASFTKNKVKMIGGDKNDEVEMSCLQNKTKNKMEAK